MAPGKSNDALDFVCLQHVAPDSCKELHRDRGSDTRSRNVKPPAAYYPLHASGLLRFFLNLKDLLRLFVRAIYLFPILLVAKLVLWIMDLWYGDLITVAFVGLLVIFFALFAVWVLLYAFVGPPSKRKGDPRFALPEPDQLREVARRWGSEGLPVTTGTEELQRLAGGGATEGDDVLRIRGKIHGGYPLDEARSVAVDVWEAGEDQKATRVFAGRTFAVTGEGQPPVLVRLQGAPWIVATWRDDDPRSSETVAEVTGWPSLRDEPQPPIRSGLSAALGHGDEVELIVRGWEAIPSVDEAIVAGVPFHLRDPGGEAGSPYRGSDVTRGLLVTSSVDHPIIVAAHAAQ